MAVAVLCDSAAEAWGNEEPNPWEESGSTSGESRDFSRDPVWGLVNAAETEAALWERLEGAIAGALIEGWRRRGVERMLPAQRRALAETRLLRRGNVLVCAPSSAGKTWIGEVALARALSEGRRAAYLVPTRALAEEKAAELGRWLAPAGLEVVCATAERPEADRRVAMGEFNLLVAVYEKLHHYVMTQPQALAGLGTVVVDEIQTLGEDERGPGLDVLLTRLREGARPPQVVGLCPPVGDAARLARWLGAELVAERRRPRDLREGVLDLESGVFNYRSANSGEFGRESLGKDGRLAEMLEQLMSVRRAVAEGREPAPQLTGIGLRRLMDAEAAGLLAAAAVLAERNEQSLVFAPTRRSTQVWAWWLERAWCDRSDCKGEVGFHHALVEPEGKREVERAFNSGRVRVLIATPTLGAGINLRAHNVLQCSWCPGGGCVEDGADGLRGAKRPWRRMLPRERFTNHGGRAARLGKGAGPGRSVLIAATPQAAGRLWDDILLAPEPELAERTPTARPVEAILWLLGGEVRRTAANLARTLGEMWQAEATGRRPDEAEVERALGDAAEAGLAARESGAWWRLTPLGEAAARFGFRIETAVALAAIAAEMRSDGHAARQAEARVELPPERALRLLVRLGALPEAADELRGLGVPCRADREPCVETISREGRVGSAAGPAEFLAGLNGAEARALVAAQAMLNPATDDAASRALDPGQIRAVGEALARYVNALAMILQPEIAACSQSDGAKGFALSLRSLAARLQGEPHDAAACAEQKTGAAPGKNSHPQIGFNSAKDTDEAPREKEEEAKSPAKDTSASGDRVAALLELNLQSPGIIRLGGREARLPPLSFDLLAALAERPGEVVTREALYHRLWPEGGPEEQQLDGHRRTLARRLANEACPEKQLVEVIRGIGFRLSLSAKEVNLVR